jgi:two-component system alkaline phosphatase synthesis response regulator PhoP
MPSGRRILLVDDDDGVREVARMSLELVGGYTVTTASSGEEAIEVARRDAPDAILLDVMMPGLDGPGTFAVLHAQVETRHIPVVLLTAKAQTADRRRFGELGVAGVLTKPFDALALPGDVAELLSWTS